MTSWDDDEPRPVTGWDYVAAGVWLIGFGALLILK